MSLINVIGENLMNDIVLLSYSKTNEINATEDYSCSMKKAIKNSSKNAEEFSYLMGVDKRTLDYIKSKTGRHRFIKFHEAIEFAIIANYSLNDCLSFLSVCNYSLNLASIRDKYILLILAYNHKNDDELMERLDCFRIINADLADKDYKTCLAKIQKLKKNY